MYYLILTMTTSAYDESTAHMVIIDSASTPNRLNAQKELMQFNIDKYKEAVQELRTSLPSPLDGRTRETLKAFPEQLADIDKLLAVRRDKVFKQIEQKTNDLAYALQIDHLPIEQKRELDYNHVSVEVVKEREFVKVL